MSLEIYEMTLSEVDNELGVNAISVVESSAIESDFVALNNHKEHIELAEVSKEKRLLLGALLIPNKPILRVNPKTNKEYYIFFKEDTIAKISQRFLKLGNQSNATLQHKEKVNGVFLVESWIVEDTQKDKSSIYGMKLPKGTWCGAMLCDNEEIYNLAKEGKIKGFSIEGYFNNQKRFSEEKFLKELDELLQS